MDRLFYDLLNKVHQDHRDLCARGLALRRKLCAAAAGDQPGCHGPAHCVVGPCADLRGIGIGGQLRAGAHVIAAGLRITEEDGRKLSEQKKKLYAEYRKAKADMQEVTTIKANIDYLLGYAEPGRKKEQER